MKSKLTLQLSHRFEIILKTKSLKFILLIILIITVPFFKIILKYDNISSVEIIGDNVVTDCFFSSSDYLFYNSGSKTSHNNNRVIFNKPEETKNPIRLRFHFNPLLVNGSKIDSILINYDSGRVRGYPAKIFFSNVYWKGNGIDYTYNNNDFVTFIFLDETLSDPYFEFNTDMKIISQTGIAIYIGAFLLFLLLLLNFNISFKYMPIFLIGCLGYYSFFSTILINNLFVGIICLIAIYQYYKNRKVHFSIITFFFITMFIVKIVWTMIPHNSAIFLMIFEKYLPYLLLPVAFVFIRVDHDDIVICCKAH